MVVYDTDNSATNGLTPTAVYGIATSNLGFATGVNAVPGRTYTFYRLFQSTTQHAVYHAGQIVLPKKMLLNTAER